MVGAFSNLLCEHTGSNGLSFATAMMTTYFSHLHARDTNCASAPYVFSKLESKIETKQ